MIRRDFFKRALALVGVCGGAATVSGVDLRGVRIDARLFISDPVRDADGLVIDFVVREIGWFDQKPGDRVTAVWPGVRTERWTVTGGPYVDRSGLEPVAGVEIAKADYVEAPRH